MEEESSTVCPSSFNDGQNIGPNIAGTYNNQIMEPNICKQILKEIKKIGQRQEQQMQLIKFLIKSSTGRRQQRQWRQRRNKVRRNQAIPKVTQASYVLQQNSSVSQVKEKPFFRQSPEGIKFNDDGENQEQSNKSNNLEDQGQDIQDDVPLSAKEGKRKRIRKQRNEKKKQKANYSRKEIKSKSQEYKPEKWRTKKILSDLKFGKRITRNDRHH